MTTASTIDSSSQQTGTAVNPVLGRVDSLIYYENDDNLVEVKLRQNDSGNIYIYTSATSDAPNSDSITIKIVNLNNFSSRLQEAFNNRSLVSLAHKDDKLVSLAFTRETAIIAGIGGSNGSWGP